MLVHVLRTSVYAGRCHSRRSIPVQIFCTSGKWKNAKDLFASPSHVLENWPKFVLSLHFFLAFSWSGGPVLKNLNVNLLSLLDSH